jgi:hypothetical protein
MATALMFFTNRIGLVGLKELIGERKALFLNKE